MSETKIKAIRFVRKLRALADSNTNENEAQVAREQALERMKAHGLTDDDVAETSSVMVCEIPAPGDFTEAWRFALLTQVGFICNCRVLRIENKEVKDNLVDVTWPGRIIGFQVDAESMVTLFEHYETRVLEALQASGYQLLSKGEEDSFLRGMVYALQRRLDDQQRRLGRNWKDLPDDDAIAAMRVSRTKASPEAKSLVVTNVKERETQSFMDTKYKNRETSFLGKGGSYSVFLEGQAAAAHVKLMKRVRKKKVEAPTPGETTEPTSSTIVVDTGVAGEGEGAPPAPDSALSESETETTP